MKLHLPVLLRKALLACFSVCFAYSMGSVASAADLTLGNEDSLTIDYADTDSIPNLENGTLQLNGDTILLLSNCGAGDGKTYILLTGVEALLDAEGNAIVLDSSNNAISHYFDTTRPGTGFWTDATLALTDDGTLQLVRHHETVKAAQTITTRQTESLVYSYYAGISFEDITQSSSSSDSGGAIYGGSNSTITLSDNACVEFSGNTASYEGGAIYGDGTIELSGNGSVDFSGNTASADGSSSAYGGAIYGGDSGTIRLSSNGSVTFIGNTASASDGYASGGAIGGYRNSTIELSGNGSVTFSENTASNRGGAIYGLGSSTITLNSNGSVEFSGNTASYEGGAIYGDGTIRLSSNGSVTFIGNTASASDGYAYGGAIYGAAYSTIELSGNGSVTFSDNTASASGGAIYGFGGSNSTITLSGNGSVTFIGNTASASGGAIAGGHYSTIRLSGNGSVEFIGNTASDAGGAIGGGSNSTISLSNNGSVEFIGNTASDVGGAIYGHGTIELSGNDSVTFSGNTASADGSSSYAYGGAIYGDGTIELSGNGSVTFSENTASNRGGAIHGLGSSTITLNSNGSVEFIGNTASDAGGAIYGFGGSNSTITLSGNGSVTFSGNSASSSSSYATGGAIGGGSNSTISLSNNGSVEFIGNTASDAGGAIYGFGGSNSTIELSGNDSVTFSGNTADNGGAIYAACNLSIRNNDFVLFEKNAEIEYNTYRLRSIYAGDSGDVISLSASAGKSIEFRDSVYIDSGSTMDLNADYTDVEGVIHKQIGDIIFTGKYTEQHLNELLAADGLNRTATEAEILNSRTSELNSEATLYGGRLRVEDKAVLKLNGGLTVAEGGNASVEVKAAELNVGSHALNMVSGSSLELSDGAKLTATELTITTGATLAVLGSVSTEPLTEQVAALTLSNETVAGFDASRAVNTGSVSVLDGDLTLESGSLLSLDDAYLELSGNLFFDVAEGEEKIALDIAPGVITDENNQVVLFNVNGVVTFGFDGLTASADNGMVYCVKAEDYFTGNRVTESMKLVYDSSTGMVYLENAAGAVPEPTTTTLSLLALAALAARRRRK